MPLRTKKIIRENAPVFQFSCLPVLEHCDYDPVVSQGEKTQLCASFRGASVSFSLTAETTASPHVCQSDLKAETVPNIL